MRQRTAKTDEQIFILKIIQSNCYGTIKDLPYRVLEIPGEYTLYQLRSGYQRQFWVLLQSSVRVLQQHFQCTMNRKRISSSRYARYKG